MRIDLKKRVLLILSLPYLSIAIAYASPAIAATIGSVTTELATTELVTTKSTTTKSAAAKTDKKPVLHIGLIPEHNVFKQLERYQPLADFLSGQLSLDIKLQILTRYGNIVNNFVSQQLDGAFFGSFTYALAHSALNIEIIARPENSSGISTYHGLLIVRKDSGITGVKEMQGKTMVFVDAATTAGYLFPLAYLKKNGIENHWQFFRETYFSGTHEDSIYDVLDQKADIGAVKNTVFNYFLARDRRVKDELQILERSLEVPENALAVRASLDTALKQNLKTTLLTLHHSPEGQAVLKTLGSVKYIETSEQDYANVYEYAKSANLNLVNYKYNNE